MKSQSTRRERKKSPMSEGKEYNIDFAAFKAFAAEFKNESDRAAVILGAAKIDYIAYETLRRALVSTPSANDELLDGDSPLSTFSSRINVLYRLGLIAPDFARALHLVRRIRNAFAHELSGCDLNSGAHRDRVRELYAPFARFETTQEIHKSFFGTHKGASAEFRIALAIIVLRLEGMRERTDPLRSDCATVLVPGAWTNAKEKKNPGPQVASTRTEAKTATGKV